VRIAYSECAALRVSARSKRQTEVASLHSCSRHDAAVSRPVQRAAKQTTVGLRTKLQRDGCSRHGLQQARAAAGTGCSPTKAVARLSW